MAITPTYSWPLPDDTDLVKDGAEAIRDLGNAIDTTVGTLPGAGLVHIKTADFSGAVSHSFGSDADPIFSSTYDNYRIVISKSASATSDQNALFRLRANTTDLTTSVYSFQTLGYNNTTLATGRSTSQTSANIGAFSASGIHSLFILDLRGPMLTSGSKSMYSINDYFQTSVGVTIQTRSNVIESNSAYNGFTLLAGTNISGTVSIYGYKK
jgi:hypothetical protein